MSVQTSECCEPSCPPGRTAAWSPATVGIVFCAAAALCYTTANICKRQLTVLGADPTWVSCNQELVSVILLAPWLCWHSLRGQRVMPTLRTTVAIVLVGLAVQVIGNQSVVWAMSVIGLAVTVPVLFSTMLISSALLGRLVLGEHPSRRSWAALAVVLLAIFALAFGAEQVRDDPTATPPASAEMVALAVLGSMAAGMTYALLTVTIRRTVTGATRMTSLMFLTTLMGPLALGPIALARLGVDTLAATPSAQWAWMLAVGLANFLGFTTITHGLRLTPVVNANVVSASQVALAALAGMMLFREPLTLWLGVGVVLTITGIMLVGRARRAGDVV